MKIKSRKQRIEEYNNKYTGRVYDPDILLRQYFESRKWDIEKAAKKADKKLHIIEKERKLETIQIVMYEYPMKTDRPRTSLDGHTYSPNAKNNRRYFEENIKKYCKEIHKVLSLITTPSEIIIDAYLEMPKAVPPDEVLLFEANVLNIVDMPDYDNIGKCYTDILKDVLISDDDIFCGGAIRKYYSVLPRVVITITYLTKHESDYVYRKIKSRKSIKTAIQDGRLELSRLNY